MRLEVVQSLLARYHFLSGMAQDAAWQLAVTQAAKIVPQKVTVPSAP